MKLANSILMLMFFLPMSSQAATFCLNEKLVNGRTKAGASWMVLLRDHCPSTANGVPSMRKFKYVLESKDAKTCVYRSPRTKTLGDRLKCETGLSRAELNAKIEASDVMKANAALKKYARRLNRPVDLEEESLYCADCSPAPSAPAQEAPLPPGAPLGLR